VWLCGIAKQHFWLGSGRYPGRCNRRHTNSDADAYRNSYTYTWTDHTQRQREKGRGNKYIASHLERGDLKQCRRQPQWNCDRDRTEHGHLY